MQSLRSLHTAPRRTFQQIRNFHPTRPSPYILEASASFLNGIHAVSGLPWGLSIPLAAVIVRMTVGLPATIFSKQQMRKEQDLYPLIHAWRRSFSDEAGLSRYSRPPGNLVRSVMKNTRTKQKSIQERLKVKPYLKYVPLLQLPIWFSIMESLRLMSGMNGFFASKLDPSSATESSSSLVFQESFSTEGVFWFQDLLAGDSTGILPAILTASLMLNIRNGFVSPSLPDIADLPKLEFLKSLFTKGVEALVYCISINVGLSAHLFGMTPALMIYWITSVNLATLQTFLLEKYMFARKPLKSWKKLYVGSVQPGESNPLHKK